MCLCVAHSFPVQYIISYEMNDPTMHISFFRCFVGPSFLLGRSSLFTFVKSNAFDGSRSIPGAKEFHFLVKSGGNDCFSNSGPQIVTNFAR